MKKIKNLFILILAFVFMSDYALAEPIPPQYIPYFNQNASRLNIPSVTMQTSGYFNQLESYKQGFQNMDSYMLLKKDERIELRERRRETSDLKDNSVLTPMKIVDEYRGIWFRPYGSFEKVQLENGPDVANNSYGAYVGFDTEMVEFGKGWSGNVGLFGGYNGSHQTYEGVGIYMNGGSFGAVGSVYKGNYFAGITTSAGVHTGTASARPNDYDVFIVAGGVAAKTGYNLEIKKGSVIVQPSLGVSYTFVSSFDYNTSIGKVRPDPLSAIQIEPTVKLVWNWKNKWQPYALFSADWNIMDKTDVDLISYQLPQISVKPYVKYGLGVRKRWNDRFAFSEQNYAYCGGRRGFGVNVDLKMAVGK